MPNDIQIHGQVPLSNAKILKETKAVLNKMLQKFDTIISKRDSDIGQMDLIEMHIATRLDTASVAAHPYPSALKHHDFLKQEIKNLLDAGIIHKSICLWASHIVLVNKHTPEGSSQQFHLCVDYRKLNSPLPSVKPAIGTKKGIFNLMPLPKIEQRSFTTCDLHSGYYNIKLDEESILKSAFTTVFVKFKFLRLPFSLSQGPDFSLHLIYLFGLDKTSNQSQGSGYLAYLDEILIHSKSKKEHLQMLDSAFKHL